MNLRDRERGAVAIVIGVLWTALFGLAVLAVDFGYLYAKRRGLQSVADTVLKPAMLNSRATTGPSPRWPSPTPTGSRACSGYDDDGGATTRVEYLTTAGPSRLEVEDHPQAPDVLRRDLRHAGAHDQRHAQGG